ncbi:hypothetical protein YSA_06694 [Pseudomonas putida ND6]|uniref:Uncharacterized protein n=1 Tax=Pseudomonas putida ND6 TaxID=231023 RepID=I3UY02_PSEPU|nr:hypothetical protein YSA_06694 [Pseudomonas putida ND6]
MQQLLSLWLQMTAPAITAIVPTFIASKIRGLMQVMSKRPTPAYSHIDP